MPIVLNARIASKYRNQCRKICCFKSFFVCQDFPQKLTKKTYLACFGWERLVISYHFELFVLIGDSCFCQICLYISCFQSHRFYRNVLFRKGFLFFIFLRNKASSRDLFRHLFSENAPSQQLDMNLNTPLTLLDQSVLKVREKCCDLGD